jgi:hypothetical protein
MLSTSEIRELSEKMNGIYASQGESIQGRLAKQQGASRFSLKRENKSLRKDINF